MVLLVQTLAFLCAVISFASASPSTPSSHRRRALPTSDKHHQLRDLSLDLNYTIGAGAGLHLGGKKNQKVALSWYAGWHADDFPLSKVSWGKYTQLTYAFGITTPDPSKISLADSDKTLLRQMVALAHKNEVKASLSIGGWTGSLYFSSNLDSPQNRTKFVEAVTTLAETYDLDGIDFDWEYPGRQGIGCNTISPHDTSNFLLFLQELRSTSIGCSLVLSAAVSLNPFASSTGSPSKSVSQFASYLDFIEIMNYDVWGSWSSGVGPNAPLDDSCVSSPSQAQGSAVSAVAAWTSAGFPPDQIILGCASYGHSFSVPPSSAFVSGSKTELAPYPPFNASNQPVGDAWDGAPAVDVCGILEGQGGVFDFWGLIAGGFLNSDGSVAKGIASRFDQCSQTPYVYNPKSQVMVSYDNAQSFAAKGQFIKKSGLLGFAIWEAGGDFNDILLNSIRSGAGF